MQINKQLVGYLATLFVVTLSGSVCIAHASEAVNEEQHAAVHEPEHLKWSTGVFVGATEVHEEWESTLGFELAYHFNQNWSAFALIERSERKKDTTLEMLGLRLHPWKGLALVAGVGRKDPGEERESTVRLGLAYEIHLGNNWFLEPAIAVDTIDNEEELVVGAYLGKKF